MEQSHARALDLVPRPRSNRMDSTVISHTSRPRATVDGAVRPASIECRGRNLAVVRFTVPLDVAQDCETREPGSAAYLIGVSHARLWFVADGQAIRPVPRGFIAEDTDMNIMPWETPADALRRQTCLSNQRSLSSRALSREPGLAAGVGTNETEG
jgi:hypothetical protein